MRFDLAFIVYKKKKKKVRQCISEQLIFASAEEWSAFSVHTSSSDRLYYHGNNRGHRVSYNQFLFKINHTLSGEMADANIQSL